MAKKKKKTQLSSEGKTELAKAIAEKSQTFARTYANVEIKVGKFFRWISGWLDKLLFNQKHGKVVALILAVLFYVTFNSQGANFLENVKSAEDLGDFPVSQVLSNQAYEVSGLPETVKVRIIGDLTDIKSVKQQKNFKVIANMTDLTEGTHEVKLTTEAMPARVEVVLEPSTVVVTIKKNPYGVLPSAMTSSTVSRWTPYMTWGNHSCSRERSWFAPIVIPWIKLHL